VATDLARVVADLLDTADLEGRRVVDVGAGGGQLAAWAAVAAEVLAVDPDAAALDGLRARAEALGLDGRFRYLPSDFGAVREAADVVLFEFCLHEMADPAAALRHAAGLAPQTVVIDHAPGSPWAWVVDEAEKVDRAWAAVRAAGPRRVRRFEAVQRFPSFTALVERVRSQGDEAVRRSEAWRGPGEIAIPMAYAVALLRA